MFGCRSSDVLADGQIKRGGMLCVVIDDLRGAPPIPRCSAAGRHGSSGIPVVERKSAAGDFEAKAVSCRETARGGLQIEFPEMNFVGDVSRFGKQPARTSDTDADEFGGSAGF